MDRKTIISIGLGVIVAFIGIMIGASVKEPCPYECVMLREKAKAERELQMQKDNAETFRVTEIKRLEAEKAKAETEAIKAKAIADEPESVKLERIKFEQTQKALDAQRKHELELERAKTERSELEAKAKVEAAAAGKPEGATEGLGDAAKWAAGAYVIGKGIGALSK